MNKQHRKHESFHNANFAINGKTEVCYDNLWHSATSDDKVGISIMTVFNFQ